MNIEYVQFNETTYPKVSGRIMVDGKFPSTPLRAHFDADWNSHHNGRIYAPPTKMNGAGPRLTASDIRKLNSAPEKPDERIVSAFDAHDEASPAAVLKPDMVWQIAQHCGSPEYHWKVTEKGPACVKKPLRRAHIERHVSGKGPRIGLSPIAPGTDTTRIAVLDFDSHKGEVKWPAMTAKARSVKEQLEAQGMRPVAFRSSGGRGIHLIVLWDAPQDAHSVREYLAEGLLTCGLENGAKGVAKGQVEIFPKQDSVSAEGFGNMFVLPLAGKSVLLDDSFEPTAQLPAQWPKSRPVPVLQRSVREKQAPAAGGSHDEVKALLAKISNDGPADYEWYFRIIAAIHDATGGDDDGLALANEWSARNDAHVDGFLEEKIWQYARSDRDSKYTIDTLRAEARKHERVVDHFPDLGPAAKQFRDESRAIGEGPVEEHRTRHYDQESMLAEAVFISEGAQVALRDDPRIALAYADFEKLTAGSEKYRVGKKGRPKSCARAWLEHPSRVTVHTRTFKAGAPLFCRSPDDFSAINTWREPPRVTPPDNWRELAQPFLDHVGYLVPAAQDREFLLDWLAHIEQDPGVLPHVHVLMFTRRQGIGRNLLTSILARVWAGVTALDVDLPALLEGGFNGRLARKTFAVVNEVREGGGGGANAYRHAQRLRTLLTDAQRRVNPKYGREYDEFNAVRWLMLSNHESALPLDRFDRRIYAIRNPDAPKGAAYYTRLYAMAAGPSFIASVREVLRTRDISKFNPGMTAPMTETKQQVVEASMSDADLAMQELIENYPSDCITSEALGAKLFGLALMHKERASMRFVAEREGAVKYPSRVWINGSQYRVWVLRNHESWLKADATAVVREVERGVAEERVASLV